MKRAVNKYIPAGYDLSNIKKHFRSKARMTLIQQYFKNYGFLKRITDQDINNIQNILGGCSIYDVDGSYVGEGNKIYQEQTNVVMILVLMDLDSVYAKYPEKRSLIYKTAKALLEEPFEFELNLHDNLNEPWQKETISYFEAWRRSVGLTIYGYIVFSICNYMERLLRSKKLSWDELDDAIFVTSEFTRLTITEKMPRLDYRWN